MEVMGTNHREYSEIREYTAIGPQRSRKKKLLVTSCILALSVSTCLLALACLWPILLDSIFQTPPGSEADIVHQPFDLRVTKGLGTREYGNVRISLITDGATPPLLNFFDYSQQFLYRWTDKFLHSSLKVASQDGHTSFNVGVNISIRLPAQGTGVAGLLIADPCVNSAAGSWVGCTYGDKYRTLERIPNLINAFMQHDDIDFWSISGDNFYDRTGAISSDIFARISLKAKSAFFFTVPGNHDFWVYGLPIVGTKEDQCGNGFMQFYAQDTKAAEKLVEGSSSPPFNFHVDPDTGGFLGFGCSHASLDNFVWYNQLGNVGFVGQSGAHSLEESLPFMMEACAWLPQQPGLDVVILMGHWDSEDCGAADHMAVPLWYRQMVSLPGCKDFNDRGMMKYVMGHTHCNSPHPRGDPGAGFRVAGFGMSSGDCDGSFGMPVVDTSEGRVRFWYFDTSTDESYQSTLQCVVPHGWRRCTHLATQWLDQPIAVLG